MADSPKFSRRTWLRGAFSLGTRAAIPATPPATPDFISPDMLEAAKSGVMQELAAAYLGLGEAVKQYCVSNFHSLSYYSSLYSHLFQSALTKIQPDACTNKLRDDYAKIETEESKVRAVLQKYIGMFHESPTWQILIDHMPQAANEDGESAEIEQDIGYDTVIKDIVRIRMRGKLGLPITPEDLIVAVAGTRHNYSENDQEGIPSIIPAEHADNIRHAQCYDRIINIIKPLAASEIFNDHPADKWKHLHYNPSEKWELIQEMLGDLLDEGVKESGARSKYSPEFMEWVERQLKSKSSELIEKQIVQKFGPAPSVDVNTTTLAAGALGVAAVVQGIQDTTMQTEPTEIAPPPAVPAEPKALGHTLAEPLFTETLEKPDVRVGELVERPTKPEMKKSLGENGSSEQVRG